MTLPEVFACVANVGWWGCIFCSILTCLKDRRRQREVSELERLWRLPLSDSQSENRRGR
jgi:hypothetical protein